MRMMRSFVWTNYGQNVLLCCVAGEVFSRRFRSCACDTCLRVVGIHAAVFRCVDTTVTISTSTYLCYSLGGPGAALCCGMPMCGVCISLAACTPGIAFTGLHYRWFD